MPCIYLPGHGLLAINTRVRTTSRTTPAITTEYHLKFANIAFLSRLFTRKREARGHIPHTQSLSARLRNGLGLMWLGELQRRNLEED